LHDQARLRGRGQASRISDLNEVDGLDDGDGQRHKGEEDEPGDFGSAPSIFLHAGDVQVKKKAGKAERARMVMMGKGRAVR
jgi:hypothetical protein